LFFNIAVSQLQLELSVTEQPVNSPVAQTQSYDVTRDPSAASRDQTTSQNNQLPGSSAVSQVTTMSTPIGLFMNFVKGLFFGIFIMICLALIVTILYLAISRAPPVCRRGLTIQLDACQRRFTIHLGGGGGLHRGPNAYGGEGPTMPLVHFASGPYRLRTQYATQGPSTYLLLQERPTRTTSLMDLSKTVSYSYDPYSNADGSADCLLPPTSNQSFNGRAVTGRDTIQPPSLLSHNLSPTTSSISLMSSSDESVVP